jgi:hypothetical protein
VLKDAAGVTQWTRDDVEGPADLPALAGNEGYALFTNGESLEWRPVSQVPDVTGQSGKVLSNDGETTFWKTQVGSGIPALASGKWLTNDGENMAWADLPSSGASSGTSSFRVGNMLVQMGSSSAPATGADSTSKAVVFDAAYSSCLHVSITPTSNSQPSGGPVVGYLSAAPSTTGFTAVFDVAEGKSSSSKINNAVPFTWIAVGLVA